jgi:hypothetical protein
MTYLGARRSQNCRAGSPKGACGFERSQTGVSYQHCRAGAVGRLPARVQRISDSRINESSKSVLNGMKARPTH